MLFLQVYLVDKPTSLEKSNMTKLPRKCIFIVYQEKLVDKSGLANETEIEFLVQPDQAEISAIILGNVSKIDLKMPIGKSKQLLQIPRND